MAPDYLLDLFAQFGPVRIRRMFGMQGLFAGERMIGFAGDDALYLKTDEATRGAFEAEGCEAFVYRKASGEEIAMSYYRIPDRLYDDPEELAEWARKAEAVAAQTPTAKRKQRAALKRPAGASR
ncbi:MAG: TfoX/Sxy family protein [Rhizomicrobium sp.]|nr:TfoX/Sxy family protein [Rhizomicrobium sp.]